MTPFYKVDINLLFMDFFFFFLLAHGIKHRPNGLTRGLSSFVRFWVDPKLT